MLADRQRLRGVVVGAWGPGLFSDDLACDVRGDYREMFEDGVSDDEATRRIVQVYGEADDDEAPVVWLALAVTQSRLGRLDDLVGAQALRVIDEGVYLRWWADSRERVKRQAMLQKVRAQLTGPQPARRTVRPPRRQVTDLRPGELLGYRATNGRWALLRVVRIDEHPLSAAPSWWCSTSTATNSPNRSTRTGWSTEPINRSSWTADRFHRGPTPSGGSP